MARRAALVARGICLAFVACSPCLQVRGCSRPAGKPSWWHGHHGYRNCFTRRACPARTVNGGSGVVRRARQKRPPTKPFSRRHAETATCVGNSPPDGGPAFIPLPGGRGMKAGFWLTNAKEACREYVWGMRVGGLERSGKMFMEEVVSALQGQTCLAVACDTPVPYRGAPFSGPTSSSRRRVSCNA